MKLIKRIFCIHVYEYEKDYNGELIKVCRICEKVKKL